MSSHSMYGYGDDNNSLINKHAVAWWDPCLERRLLCVIILNHDTLGALIFSGYVLLEDIRTIY